MMEARGALVFSLGLIVVVGLLGLLVSPRSDERNWEVFTEMAYSKAGESNTLSSVLPGGTTQQALVAGVVPRGQLPLRFEASPDGATLAGERLRLPAFTDEATADRRGAHLYRIYCALCHGAGGDGRGPVVQRGMLPPPSLMGARARQMADGALFHVLSFGQGNMAAYATQMTREERWLVVRHVRELQKEQ